MRMDIYSSSCCLNVYIYIYTFKGIHIHRHHTCWVAYSRDLSMCVRIDAHMCVIVYTCMNNSGAYIVCVHTYVYIYIHMCTNVLMYFTYVVSIQTYNYV